MPACYNTVMGGATICMLAACAAGTKPHITRPTFGTTINLGRYFEMKKLLAVLLSLCLVVGMLPMMAFADDVADTPQANFENTDVLNEGSQDDQSGGDHGDDSGQGGGDQGLGAENPNAENPEAENPNAYNPNSINSLDELKRALAAKAPRLVLGQNMVLKSFLNAQVD